MNGASFKITLPLNIIHVCTNVKKGFDDFQIYSLDGFQF